MPRRLALLALALTLAALPGCLCVDTHSTVRQPTLGTQLCDLKTALDKGAMNQAEYDTAKQRLLAGGK